MTTLCRLGWLRRDKKTRAAVGVTPRGWTRFRFKRQLGVEFNGLSPAPDAAETAAIA